MGVGIEIVLVINLVSFNFVEDSKKIKNLIIMNVYEIYDEKRIIIVDIVFRI